MRPVMFSLPLLACLVALTGCKGGPKVSDKNLRELDVKQVRAVLQEQGAAVMLVDARPADQFDQGHLPGAINLFLPDVKAGDGRLQQADRIIVYAAGWQDSLGPATAKRLMSLKYHNVYLFRGGYEVWRQRAVSSTQPATSPGVE